MNLLKWGEFVLKIKSVEFTKVWLIFINFAVRLTAYFFSFSFPFSINFGANSDTLVESPSCFTIIHYSKLTISYFFWRYTKIKPVCVTCRINIVMKQQTIQSVNLRCYTQISTLKPTIKNQLRLFILDLIKIRCLLMVGYNKIIMFEILQLINSKNICIKHLIIKIIIELIINQ